MRKIGSLKNPGNAQYEQLTPSSSSSEGELRTTLSKVVSKVEKKEDGIQEHWEFAQTSSIYRDSPEHPTETSGAG